ncbi:BQ5605_C016g08161 [Microbotryum silenes-dioicae]|uniref:BQ5605_C016g08161 protein n=1 Tax=Microbotryum silenes-dioicae TaxID=796604 RepID=A0A2X0NZH8_9BASI|nr:BQ5605_C016g08161 [Microbotryum silenes-dioicae]
MTMVVDLIRVVVVVLVVVVLVVVRWAVEGAIVGVVVGAAVVGKTVHVVLTTPGSVRTLEYTDVKKVVEVAIAPCWRKICAHNGADDGQMLQHIGRRAGFEEPKDAKAAERGLKEHGAYQSASETATRERIVVRRDCMVTREKERM